MPRSCNNIYHGCGRVTEDGIVNTGNLLGSRMLLRRIYTQLREKRDDALIWYHMSGQVIMPLLSFADALCDGENYTSQLDRGRDRGYEYLLKLETMKAEYMGQINFGPVTAFLPEFGRAGSIKGDEWNEIGPQPAEYVLGLLMLHDSQLWDAYIHGESVTKLWHALGKVNFSHQYEFVPYWNQKVTQPLDEKDIVATFYVDRSAKRAVMFVMNFDGEPRDGKTKAYNLTVDFEKLGLDGAKVKAANLVHKEPVSLSGDSFKITFPSHTYRMILFEEK